MSLRQEASNNLLVGTPRGLGSATLSHTEVMGVHAFVCACACVHACVCVEYIKVNFSENKQTIFVSQIKNDMKYKMALNLKCRID